MATKDVIKTEMALEKNKGCWETVEDPHVFQEGELFFFVSHDVVGGARSKNL